MTLINDLRIPDAAIIGFAFLTIMYLVFRNRRLPKGLRLPPGPSSNSIFGNSVHIPTQHEWETYTRWGKEYGDLVSIDLITKRMIFINSSKIAMDLLEGRSSIYSDRSRFPMLNDLMGIDWNFVIMGYGDWWRRHRKTFHQYFHPSATVAYQLVQSGQSRSLLKRIHESPEDFLRHLRHFSGAIIMEIIYGIKVLPENDPYIDLAEKVVIAGSQAAIPGKFLVDSLPILKYVPEWMPGASFKKQARIGKQIFDKMPVLPFMAVKKTLNDGTASPSFTASLLDQLEDRKDAPSDEELVIRNTAATAYSAGADTTTASLSWFILAMVLYPDVQRKAQVELDSEIGMDRLPTFEDRKRLPYINALCNEIQRWRPVFPLSIPHRLMQDDVYEGMFLPKGSIVISNTWAMLHDEKLYGPNPDEFNPERFFLPGVKDPAPAFGFGRRMCPGRHMADKTMFIAIASILKVFDVSHAKDQDGHEIKFNLTSTSGVMLKPDPFPCAITPRSASAESLVKQDYE